MTVRSTISEVVEATEGIFRSGAPAVRIMGLSLEDATTYRGIFELESEKYDVRVDGPSMENESDPRKSRWLYSVTVTNGRALQNA